MTNQVKPQFEQRTYSCNIRLQGSIINTVPLERVTRDELKLLAYLHGSGAVADIKYLGMYPTPTFNPDEGAPQYVEDQMGEYLRLARKYDTIVNSGRGKVAVEKCFGVQLIDFDAVIDEVNAIDSVERAAAEAEARTEVSKAAEQREEERKRSQEAERPAGGHGPIGSALAASITERGRN